MLGCHVATIVIASALPRMTPHPLNTQNEKQVDFLAGWNNRIGVKVHGWLLGMLLAD